MAGIGFCFTTGVDGGAGGRGGAPLSPLAGGGGGRVRVCGVYG